MSELKFSDLVEPVAVDQKRHYVLLFWVVVVLGLRWRILPFVMAAIP